MSPPPFQSVKTPQITLLQHLFKIKTYKKGNSFNSFMKQEECNICTIIVINIFVFGFGNFYRFLCHKTLNETAVERTVLQMGVDCSYGGFLCVLSLFF